MHFSKLQIQINVEAPSAVSYVFCYSVRDPGLREEYPQNLDQRPFRLGPDHEGDKFSITLLRNISCCPLLTDSVVVYRINSVSMSGEDFGFRDEGVNGALGELNDKKQRISKLKSPAPSRHPADPPQYEPTKLRFFDHIWLGRRSQNLAAST
jgi:hypothetical protein